MGSEERRDSGSRLEPGTRGRESTSRRKGRRVICRGDAVTDLRQGQGVRPRGLSSEKRSHKGCLELGGGIFVDVDRREVPHAGEKRGDIGGMRGVGGRLGRRENEGAPL